MNVAAIRQRFDRLTDNTKGAGIMICASALFTLMVSLVKLLGSELSIFQILFIRQVVMMLIIAPQFVHGFPGVLETNRVGLQFLRILLALFAMTFGFTAVIHIPLAEATAIGFSKSFFITIFAVIILGEMVGIRRWSAVGLGFVGVMIMLQPGPEGISFFGLMALIGAACASAVMVIIRLLSRTETSASIMAWQAFGVGVATTIPGIYFWTWPTGEQWVLLIAMGVVSYLAQRANIAAFKYGEASVLASIDYVRLLYAALLGWLLFGDLPTMTTWIGASIIVLASIYTIWRENQRKQQLTRSPDGRGYTNT